ncbi:hypothetical protein GGS20DRAFT_305269 [Poronia punctata]|nr:hypothetical protein GGS20DRAFT_305269 [Poronia punctata]
MMKPHPAQDGPARLRQLSQECGLLLHAPPAPKPRPEHPPSYCTDNDIFIAEDLLERQRHAGQNSQSRPGLVRAFANKKKTWEYKEIYEALLAHVANRGSPGVAEVLITKLTQLGGNLNLAQKSRTSLLSRRKSLDLSERSKILQNAVTNNHLEMVEVLLPHADALTLDTALPVAMRNGNDAITENLIRYGASASHTSDGQDAFRQACVVGGQAGLVAMVAGSEGRPPPAWLSQSMIDAAKAGCVETVVHLSQSTADGNYDGAAALKAAIELGRKDIALALLLGQRPPQQSEINEAFAALMGHQNINPNDKLTMTEILLCAGANGDLVAQAVVQASAVYSLEMIRLLVSYGASIEYEEAQALRKAVSKGKVDLVDAMVNGTSVISPQRASECVSLMPKDVVFEDRYFLLDAFLRRGAAGTPLDDALVHAAEVGDIQAVKLLVMPLFPDGGDANGRNGKTGAHGPGSEKHETASTDYKGGSALQVAVNKGHESIANAILTHKPPSHVVLAQVFPSTRKLPRPERYRLTELFLQAGLTGPCVHSALESAISEHPSRRDEKLISLFLRNNADVNFNEGNTITAAIAQNDVQLLEALLKGKPTAQTVARAIPKAMEVEDSSRRIHIISMLLDLGAIQGSAEISAALGTAIVARPTDKRLIRLLLQQGAADVNLNEGVALQYAVEHPDIEVLELILVIGQPNEDSVGRGLKSLGRVPTYAKPDKLKALLSRNKAKGVVSEILVHEVQALLKTPPQERNFATLKILLANGADVNASNGEALSCAVAASSMQMVDILLTASPSPATLSWVMPHALRILDPMDRLTYTQKILVGGMPPTEVNRALVFAVRRYPDDIPLINALLAHADTTDGAALITAIKTEKPDVLELILGNKRFTPDILNTGFAEATKGKNKRTRSISCHSLLKAGASGEVVSDALLAAASDGDLDFGTILVRNGGSIEHKNGQAIVEACKSGAVSVLEMLLAGTMEVSQETLRRAFQAATQVGDLKKRAPIFKLLLQMGVSGEVIDIQLVSAVRYGDEGIELVRLLLAHGASPDYSAGEAVDKAVRSAFLGSLELLLGIAQVGEGARKQQKKPSSYTLVRGLDACWDLSRDTRFTVVDWLFRAGILVPSAVHSALHRAVNEPDPEERLIRLLLSNRASPVTNGCQTLIDAVKTLSASMFDELLESRATSEDASLVFFKAFSPNNSMDWVSERGLKIATSLLGKGAKGAGVGSALVAVLEQYMTTPHTITAEFADLLLRHGANVNHNSGEAIQIAAASGNTQVLARLLREKPSAEALTSAFPKIFDAPLSEENAHELVALFADHRNGESQLDVFFEQSGLDPVVVRALTRFPRSTKILGALLDVGFYHEQMVKCQVVDEIEEPESVPLLMWALLQPQKRISTSVINLLVERGAKVNFETAISRVTPLMLAIRTRRQDVAKLLLLAGAEVDVTDALGNSPLSMASSIGGDLAIAMMSNLLAAGAPRNDGSLHNSARELNLRAMQVLIEYGHDPDFPSTLHGGRSALAELCLHATDSLEVTVSTEKAMERAIEFLLRNGSDITIHSEGKSALLLALESTEPLSTTKALLRAGFWKEINKTFNQYNDGKCTYSPTMYVQRVLPESDKKADLLSLLRANRGTDIYYANSGPQPEDSIGVPSHIWREEEERRARLDRIRRDGEDHELSIQRNKELAAVQAQIQAEQAELEEARRKRMHSSDLTALQERARVEEDLFNNAMRQQRARQLADIQHQEQLTAASVARARSIGEAELTVETQRQSRLLEWERDLGSERVGNANQLSTIRLREREALERHDKAADSRLTSRLKEQKKLVDSQTALAANVNSASARRQIGFISGELGPD